MSTSCTHVPYPQPYSLIPEYELGVLENSPKMAVLVALVDLSVANGDKVLVFRYVYIRVSEEVDVNHLSVCTSVTVKVSPPFPTLRSCLLQGPFLFPILLIWRAHSSTRNTIG